MQDPRFELQLPPAPAGMDASEWEARLELAATYRLVDHYGWTSVVYNHITLRVPGTDHFLINPFGLRYDEIRASDLVRIDLDGNQVGSNSGNWPVNRAGFVIHSAIHMADSALNHCVMHTHTRAGMAIAAIQPLV